MTFLVLVCGGRNYTNYEVLRQVLDDLHKRNQFTHLMHGDANGADRLAGRWADENGIQTVICPANWPKFDKAAGYIRNRAMADLEPDLVVAFPGGRGTANMVALASARNILVNLVTGDPA